MLITREWAMPNHNTFSIKPIKQLIERNLIEGLWLDPFSRNSPFKDITVTNDLSTDFEADYHLEALDFLKRFSSDSVDGVLFDPPYSPRQISECYKNVGRAVHMKDTQSSFYTERKQEVARLVKKRGIVISFGWNSGGIGKTLGFEIIEIMLVAHGGAHNDTIVTVERKL
jgi:16S rRNA G966 N2-methylase RsmD